MTITILSSSLIIIMIFQIIIFKATVISAHHSTYAYALFQKVEEKIKKKKSFNSQKSGNNTIVSSIRNKTIETKYFNE